LWWRREVPRALVLLMGVVVEGETLDELDEELAGLVEVRRIELANDFEGLEVGGLGDGWAKWLRSRSTTKVSAKGPNAKVHSIEIGSRKSPFSAALYSRHEREAVQRGAPRVALHQDWAAAGWEGGEVWRWESRRWGGHLRLRRRDGSTLDATRPTAPLRDEVLDELAADDMSRVWRVDPKSPKAKRQRDRRECPVWAQMRAWASGAELGAPRPRYTTSKDVAVRGAKLAHHMRATVRELAHVETLAEGSGDGAEALRRVTSRLGSDEWRDRCREAQRLHADVLARLRASAESDVS